MVCKAFFFHKASQADNAKQLIGVLPQVSYGHSSRLSDLIFVVSSRTAFIIPRANRAGGNGGRMDWVFDRHRRAVEMASSGGELSNVQCTGLP